MFNNKIKMFLVVAFLACAPACGGEEDESAQKDPTSSESSEESVKSTDVLKAITCPSGSSVQLSDIPQCEAYFKKLVTDCCPKASSQLEQALQQLACMPSGADAACKTALDTSFSMVCDQFKNNPACN